MKVMASERELGPTLQLDFGKLAKVAACGQALIPVAVQHVDTKEVLIIAYVNQLALEHTLRTGNATFWSTSRNELWEKGATSGDVLRVIEIRVNCEQNSLLYLVRPLGKGACHVKKPDGTPYMSCFYRRLRNNVLEPVE
ncbi:MAG: phosphoribosyl-AMP cyclohydrolase [bacterium]|nr:phosphoribosyl-AMP cyclohydrolase [bacterium]